MDVASLAALNLGGSGMAIRWHRDTTRAVGEIESIITVSNDDVFAIQGRTLHCGLIVMCNNDCGYGAVVNKL